VAPQRRRRCVRHAPHLPVQPFMIEPAGIDRQHRLDVGRLAHGGRSDYAAGDRHAHRLADSSAPRGRVNAVAPGRSGVTACGAGSRPARPRTA
jgi:hypothetical protein